MSGWALAAAGIYWAATKYGPGALWIAIGVVSHWVLDVVTHRPDMPLWLGGPKVGLGLWNSVSATLALESVMFAAALWIYVRTTIPRNGVGRWAFVAFVVLVLVIYAANAMSPTPPSERAVAWVTLSLWLLPVWAAWFDRHRDPVPPARATP